MRRLLTALALLLAMPLWVWACLWDEDTPADEAKGLPEVVAVLTGRFARNPPLYYEMRLSRVTANLRTDPEDLAEYDNAGVACDRLGRGDEAISWMEKKRAQLDRLESSQPKVKEHWYRYHANLGTFLVHRWVRQGADRTKIEEVKAAHEQITKALEINPQAHFGREKYQLRAIEWMIEPPKAEGQSCLPNLLGWPEKALGDVQDPKLADEAVRGLSGLIVLGNAWESIDIFHALDVALQNDTLGFERFPTGGRNTLAFFARLRCVELIDAGKGSMLPDAPKGQSLKTLLLEWDLVRDDVKDDYLQPAYVKLRKEADSWQAARMAFMLRRLKLGRHPDTDRDFWLGYTEQPAPSLPEFVPTINRMLLGIALFVVVVVSCLAVALAVGLRAFIRWRKARRRKAGPADFSAAGLVDEIG